MLIAQDSPDDAFLLNRAIENTGTLAVPQFVSDGEEGVLWAVDLARTAGWKSVIRISSAIGAGAYVGLTLQSVVIGTISQNQGGKFLPYGILFYPPVALAAYVSVSRLEAARKCIRRRATLAWAGLVLIIASIPLSFFHYPSTYSSGSHHLEGPTPAVEEMSNLMVQHGWLTDEQRTNLMAKERGWFSSH